MMEFWNSMKGAAAAVVQQIGQCRWGLVSSSMGTDTAYLAKVNIQPEQVPTSWLPVLTPIAGAGWGLVAPPDGNAQAFMASDRGDGQHAVILGFTYSNAARPPVPPSNFNQTKGTAVVPGELALVSKSGGVIRLCSDGSIHIKGDVRIDGSLSVQNSITANTGDITATKGDVSDTHGSLNRLRSNYNPHTHGNSPPPSPQDPE